MLEELFQAILQVVSPIRLYYPGISPADDDVITLVHLLRNSTQQYRETLSIPVALDYRHNGGHNGYFCSSAIRRPSMVCNSPAINSPSFTVCS